MQAMAYKIETSRKAERDFENAVACLACGIGGENAATNLKLALLNRVAFLEEFPHKCAFPHAPNYAEQGYRLAPFHNYVALYTFDEKVVRIERVFPQKANYAHYIYEEDTG